MERKKRTRKQGKYSQGENGISENEKVLTLTVKTLYLDFAYRITAHHHITPCQSCYVQYMWNVNYFK